MPPMDALRRCNVPEGDGDLQQPTVGLRGGPRTRKEGANALPQ